MIKAFLSKYQGSLCGKRVIISGCTGGIGSQLCRYILTLGGALVMLDRNQVKSEVLEKQLKSEFENADIKRICANMQSIESVKAACEMLKGISADILIHNAGAYKIPREKSDSGYDNVFTINFISPYYITRQLKDCVKKTVIVGSIAHNYSKSDDTDIDFSRRNASHLVYGNAKRYLMYSHFELFKDTPKSLAVTHPGITLTGITDHYPKWLYIIIKPLMRVVFMKPKHAALSVLAGVFDATEPYSWIGPAVFDIWGGPKHRKIHTASKEEISKIYNNAEKIYNEISTTHAK